MALKLFFLLVTGVSLCLASKWSYAGSSGPMFWRDLFPTACAGDHQSPIDIQAERTIYDPDLKDFAIWYDPPKPGSKMYLKNNGHTVQVDLEGEFYVTNAGLPHVYKAAQFHFHWGHHAIAGSEHKMEGVASPIEMHLVTYNKDLYDHIGAAVQEKGGLAVLGVMFEVSEEDNPAFANIVTALKHVKDPEVKKRISLPLTPLRDLLPSDISRYFRYNGSLTTPGCFESVTWTVFDVKQKISHRQLHEFRKMLQLKRHHKKHQGGSRRRRSAESRAEKAAEAVATELGVVGDQFEEAMLKEKILETKQEEVAAAHSNTHNKHEGHSSGGHSSGGQSSDHSSSHSSGGHHAPDAGSSSTHQVMFSQDKLVNNYRPVQPLNGRLVYRSFKLGQPPVVVVQAAPEAESEPPVYTAEVGSRGHHGDHHGDHHRNAGVKARGSVFALVTAVMCLLVKL